MKKDYKGLRIVCRVDGRFELTCDCNNGTSFTTKASCSYFSCEHCNHAVPEHDLIEEWQYRSAEAAQESYWKGFVD